MRRIALIAWFLVALGCGREAQPARSAIVGGMPSGRASVVYTVQTGSTVLCAGTVVGPRDILTVQRCVTPAGSDTPIPPGAINVGVGASIDNPERTVAVEEIFIDSSSGPEVLALIRTRETLGLPAVPLATAAPTVGETVILVGFGRTDAALAGNRHEGDSMISALGSGTFEAVGDAFACGEGDDGGPALSISGEVVGVGGLPGNDECPPTNNTYASVFDGVRFVEDNLAPPLPDAGAPPDVDAGPEVDAGEPRDAGDGRMVTEEGCGCATVRPTPASSAWVWLALLGILGARQRASRCAGVTSIYGSGRRPSA